MSYRIDYIKISNYKLFSEETTFSFKTDRSFHGDNTTEKICWDGSKHKVNKYKKVIGLWGKNSSGKSSVLNAFGQWVTLYAKANTFDPSVMNLPINNEESIFQESVEEDENSSEFFPNSFFNDVKKPVKIEVGFSTNGFSFSYMLSESIVPNNFRAHSQSELFNIYKNDELTYSWDGSKTGRKVFNIAAYINSYENALSADAYTDKKWKEKIIKTVQDYTMNSLDVPSIQGVLDNEKEILQAYKIMEDFKNNNMLFKVHQYSALRPTSAIKYINRDLESIYNDFNIGKETINKVVNQIVMSLDENATKVDIDYKQSANGHKLVRIFRVVNSNGNSYLPAQLSTGTLFFLQLSISLWYKELFNKKMSINDVKYVFIDELGANWHTNLTDAFLSMICNDVFGKTIVIFTTHDADLGNNLPIDVINVINRNRQIVSLADFKGKNNKLIRRDKKFSQDYLNDAIDVYSTNPILEEFDPLPME